MSSSFVTLWTAKLLCPWDFQGKNTGVGCHFLLWGIISTEGLNLHLLHWQADSLPLSHQGNPYNVVTYLIISSEKSRQWVLAEVSAEDRFEEDGHRQETIQELFLSSSGL